MNLAALTQGAGGLAAASPFGAAASVLSAAVSTPASSNAEGGRIAGQSVTFGGIQTGGTSGFPWYVWAGLAVVGAVWFLRRK